MPETPYDKALAAAFEAVENDDGGLSLNEPEAAERVVSAFLDALDPEVAALVRGEKQLERIAGWELGLTGEPHRVGCFGMPMGGPLYAISDSSTKGASQ